MIYSTFKQVDEQYTYVQEQIDRMVESAENYIKSVLREVGAIEITVDNKPTVIATQGKSFTEEEHVVFYQNVAKPLTRGDFSAAALFNICKEIRAMHLVEEYGDKNETNE